MATLDLHFVDELIAARQDQHGGGRGAPALVRPDVRQGAAINRSCMVMLSALLQGYIDDVFVECVPIAFPAIAAAPNYESLLGELRKGGNPNSKNISALFRKLGVPDVMAGLNWQHTTPQDIAAKLDEINQIRNRIAHSSPLSLNGQPYRLKLARVQTLRNFCAAFAARFEIHARLRVTQCRT